MDHRSAEHHYKRPFASLKTLTRLHTLHVDFDVLIDRRVDEAFDGHSMLPPCLRYLKLVMTHAHQLDSLLQSHDEKGAGNSDGPWTIIVDSFSLIKLETLLGPVSRILACHADRAEDLMDTIDTSYSRVTQSC